MTRPDMTSAEEREYEREYGRAIKRLKDWRKAFWAGRLAEIPKSTVPKVRANFGAVPPAHHHAPYMPGGVD